MLTFCYHAHMNPEEREMLERTYRLSKENNEILRAMRRSAFVGGLFKLVLWAAMIGIPIWFYMVYLAPTLNSAIKTLNDVQQTTEKAKAGLEVPATELSGMLESLKDLLPAAKSQ